MKLFIDTANLAEIKEANDLGIICGVTTNPSLVAKEGGDFHAAVREICTIVSGPVSAEVLSMDAPGMVREARALADLADNVVVKVPVCKEGLKAAKILYRDGIKTNLTLVFSPAQAILAAHAGAAYVSPFVGRLDDVGQDGMQVVRDIAEVFYVQDIATEIIAASIRHPMHVVEAAKAGADIATVPFKILEQMIKHPLTDIGIERFLADWARMKKK